MGRAPDSPDNVGPSYWADPYYQSDAYRQKFAAALKIERTRQALQRKEATPETLAHARFLVAVENDAIMSIGGFKGFDVTDAEVVREYPFLADLIAQPQEVK